MPFTVTVVPGKTFTEGELLTVDTLNALGRPTITVEGLASLVSVPAGSVNTSQLVNDAVTIDKLAPALKNGSFPAGAVVPFARATAPTGWLVCDGAAVSVDTYDVLAAAIYVGNTLNPTADYGYRVLTTTKQARSATGPYIVLPDLRGEFIRGWDGTGAGARGVDTGRTWGSDQAELVGAHQHLMFNTATASVAVASDLYAARSATTYSILGNSTAATVGLTSNGTGTETRPRNVVMLYCIKT